MNPGKNYIATLAPAGSATVLLAASVLFSLATVAPRAQAAELRSVQTTVDGVEGDERKNVLLQLEIVQHAKDPMSEAEVRELHGKAQKEIETALAPFGYFKPVVWSDLKREADHWVAHYSIDRGAPLHVDSLDVQILGEGASDPAFRGTIDMLAIKKGQVLLQRDYELAKTQLKGVAIKNGYLDARFDRSEIRVDLERYHGAVVLYYDSGPRYTFGPVIWNQNVVDQGLLDGYVTFKRGDPIDFNKLLAMQQAIGNSPFWSRVDVRPRRDMAQGHELPIVVDLTPAKPQRLTMGIGYGTDNGPHVKSTWQLRRLNRLGHRANLQGTFSKIEQSGLANYEIPWPYPKTDVLTLQTGYTQQKTVTANEQLALIGGSMARIWAGWHEAFGLNFRRDHFTVGIDHGTENFLVPDGSWSHVRTNDPVDPTNATQLRFATSAAVQGVVSATSFERAEAHVKWIKSFGRPNIITLRTAIGAIGTTSFHRLPPSVRFFAGGSESVRGYEYNALGAVDSLGHVIGGTLLEELSTEYQYRFVKQWGVAVFYDVGNAMRTWNTAPQQGAGVGLRWVSPVGLLKVDLAKPLTQHTNRIVLHLSIGPGL